jgi:Smg protein
MKESVLDVLMYLFQNYMSDDTDFHPDRESMQVELLEAGFPSREVGQALEWLDDLAARQDCTSPFLNAERSFRIYTDQEHNKLDSECQGYVLFLEQAGILNSEMRELVIDRVMALDADEIDLTQLKWIILMVLFNQPGQEEAYACMEDLLFEDVPAYLH